MKLIYFIILFLFVQCSTTYVDIDKITGIKNIVVRHGQLREDGYSQDFENYYISALEDYQICSNSEINDTINLRFKEDVEIEVIANDSIKFTDVNIIKDVYQIDALDSKPKLGKTKSYKLGKGRAIIFFPPWVYAPYGNGGIVKLELYGKKINSNNFKKVFVFKIGNSEDYQKYWERQKIK